MAGDGDRAMTKAPLGGKQAGKNATDPVQNRLAMRFLKELEEAEAQTEK